MSKSSQAKRHHLIPNFLLRNFRAAKSAGKNQVWFYRKGSDEPVLTNTNNVFSETNFYTTEDGDVSIEKDFSEREYEYSRVILDIIQNKAFTDKQLSSLLALIHHLNIRGNILRDEIMDIGQLAAEAVRKILFGNSPDKVLLTRDPSSFYEIARRQALTIVAQMQGHNVTPILYVNIVQKMEHEIKRLVEIMLPHFLEQGRDEMHKQLEEFLGFLSDERVKDLHLQTLKKSSGNRTNPELFGKFSWNLISPDSGEFLLGDTGAIGYCRSANGWRFLPLISGKDLAHIFLPLSPTLGLFGSHPNFPKSNSEIIARELNEGVATASHYGFIASDNQEIYKSFMPHIGQYSRLSSMEDFVNREIYENKERPYKNEEHPCPVHITGNFSNAKDLNAKDRENLESLMTIFSMSAEKLSLAEPLYVECVFSSDIISTTKRLEEESKSILKESQSLDSARIFIHPISVKPARAFDRIIVINSQIFSQIDGYAKAGMMFKFLKHLFEIATSTYFPKKDSPKDTKYIEDLRRISLFMQGCREPANMCFSELKEKMHVEGRSTHAAILEYLESDVIWSLQNLKNEFMPKLKECRESRAGYDELAILAVHSLRSLGVSLAHYFAISTPDERKNFHDHLMKEPIFRFVLEDEWNLISDLCDNPSDESQYELIRTLERILANCGYCWVLAPNGQYNSNIQISFSEIFEDLKNSPLHNSGIKSSPFMNKGGNRTLLLSFWLVKWYYILAGIFVLLLGRVLQRVRRKRQND